MSRERSGRASQGKARTRITSVKGNYFKVQRGELSKIQEERQSVDSNFPKQYHCKDACLLPTEDIPEVMSEMVRFRPRGNGHSLFGENQQKKPNVLDETICFLLLAQYKY